MAELHSIVRELPENIEEMVAYLEDKIARIRAGDWESLFFIGIQSNGHWYVGSSGKDRTAMEKIGVLATVLHDACAAGVSDG